MLSFQPVTARIRSRVGRQRDFFERATSIEELEPASTYHTSPAICLPGEIERVTDFVGDESLHRTRLAGGLREEGATLAYHFEGALLADFTVYGDGVHQVYRDVPKRPILRGNADEFEEAQLCTTACAQMYFGHFFHDSLVLEELAARRGLPALTFDRAPWLHEPKYRQLFDRQAIATSLAKVRRLWVVDERSLNDGWRSRFGALRDRLRAKLNAGGPEKVFITRGSLFTGRSLANEPALARMLEQRGFTILEPEKEDPEMIASTLRDAKLVVCVAGSAEVHALVSMPAGATLIEIQIAPYFGTIGKILTESIDVRWGYVVAEATENGFQLEPERLLKTLDLVA